MAIALPAIASAMGASAATAATIGTIGSVVSAVGTGVSVLGALKQGSAASSAAHTRAAVQTNNATIARQNAERAAQVGEEKAAMSQRDTRAKIGAMEASQAASGVDINNGSALDVRASETEFGQLDAQTIRSNAAREAYGYQTQATNMDSAASMSKAEAKNAKTSGFMNAATVLGTALGSSDNWGSRASSTALDDGGYLDDEDFGFNF